jgi:hypothetical protein
MLHTIFYTTHSSLLTYIWHTDWHRVETLDHTTQKTLYTIDPILVCLLQSEDYYKSENTALWMKQRTCHWWTSMNEAAKSQKPKFYTGYTPWKPYNKIVPQVKPQMTIHLNNICNIKTCTEAHTSAFPSQSVDVLLYTIFNNKAGAHIRK